MYDYIIVGAGSAGCVLANRLSADPAHRVLLLEAGGEARQREASIPAAWSRLFRSDCDWAYDTEPNPGLDGRRLFAPRGKMLGGTSGMNAMLYVRGNRADFDEWAAAGNTGWAYDDVLQFFRRSEDNVRGPSTYHGAGGPLPVTDGRDRNPLAVAFVEAAAATGIAHNDDCNGATQDGVGFLQFNIRHGRRCSAADAFLKPVLARPNLTVRTGAHAARIVIEGGTAAGVEYRVDGRGETARAEREVVLACGAFDSPKLLMLSGVGPAAELRRHDIDVVHDLPGVGRNLQEHPTGGILVRCNRPVSLLAAESRGNFLRYLLFRRGMLASPGVDAAAFVRTRPELDAPDIEILMVPVLWLDEGFTTPTEHGYTVGVVLLKPHSRGTVTLRSADPRDPPVIDTRLYSDPGGHDLRAIIDGVRIARRINAASPLAAFSAGEIEPGPDATTDDQIAAAVRRLGQTLWHPVGTCRMGVDGDAVVDPTLRVHGVEGLRVADASIMPGHIRGHTHAAAVMIGEKAAELILRGSTATATTGRTHTG